MINHPIEGLMQTTMQSIKDMVDVNTIVGDAVETKDGQVIIPISKVSFGFASGGGEYDTIDGHDSKPFAGGAGAGVSVQPVAFMVVGNNNMKLMPVDQGNNMLNSILDFIPKVTKEKKDNNIIKQQDTNN